LGYVERYRDEMRNYHENGFTVRKELLKNWDYKSQVKAYQKGKLNDWNSPNSTDVHSLYKVHKIKEYITKYCTKNEDQSEVNGRLWGSNYELSDIKGAVTIMDQDIKSELNEVIKEFKPRVYNGEYFTIIHLSIQQLQGTKYKQLYKLFGQYIFDQFHFNIQQTTSN
jgi:hypothetical protein